MTPLLAHLVPPPPPLQQAPAIKAPVALQTVECGELSTESSDCRCNGKRPWASRAVPFVPSSFLTVTSK